MVERKKKWEREKAWNVSMEGVVGFLFFWGAFSFNFGVEAYEKLADAMVFFVTCLSRKYKHHKLTQHNWPCSNFFILFFLIFFFFRLDVCSCARTKTERADSSGISFVYYNIYLWYANIQLGKYEFTYSHFFIFFFCWLATFSDVGQLFFYSLCSLLFFLLNRNTNNE